MRVATIPMEAEAEAWDPGDPEPFKRLAGTRYLRTEGEKAIVMTTCAPDGAETAVYPGWLAVRADGSGDGQALFVTPDSLTEPFGPWSPA